MIEQPLVAVVTLNWNGAAFLQECVDSILAADYKSIQVLVVDNGSTDGSMELLDELYGANFLVTVISNKENLGYSKGMNVGLDHGFRKLGADYCLVMNNDTRLDQHAISALVEVAQREANTAFVTGKVYFYNEPDTFQTVGKKKHPVLINGGHIGRGEKDHGQYDEDKELAFCDDIFWLVSKDVYLETYGYDPEFFLQSEDFEWQLRAQKRGFKIMFAHKAKLWHRESMSLGRTSPKKAYYDARNPAIAVMKNCDPHAVKRFLRTRLWKIYLPSIVKQTIKGHFCISFAMIGGLFSAWIWRLRNTARFGKPALTDDMKQGNNQ